MQLSLIVAVASNGVIGRDNGLPWHLPGDLKHFKSITMGKPIIMGRRTYESIGRALPGRTNIVLTRDDSFAGDGVERAHDLAQAMRIANENADPQNASEAMIIGGAGVYEAALAETSRIYLTEVHMEVDGDTYFPALNPEEWSETSREAITPGPKDMCDYSFVVLDRKRP